MRRPPFLGGGHIRSCGQLFSFPSSSFDFGWTLSWTWRLFVSQVVGRWSRMFLAAESDVYCDMFLIWVPFCLVLPGATWPWKDGQASDFSCPFISLLSTFGRQGVLLKQNRRSLVPFRPGQEKVAAGCERSPARDFWFGSLLRNQVGQLKTKTFLGSKWKEAAAWYYHGALCNGRSNCSLWESFVAFPFLFLAVKKKRSSFSLCVSGGLFLFSPIFTDDDDGVLCRYGRTKWRARSESVHPVPG